VKRTIIVLCVLAILAAFTGCNPDVGDDSGAETTYTVTFDANTTETVTGMPDAQTVKKGGCATSPAADPVRTGYTFAGWYKTAACDAAMSYDFSYSIAESFTLYAKWIASANSCTITFDTGNTDLKVPAYVGTKGSTTNLRNYFTLKYTSYLYSDYSYCIEDVYSDSACTEKSNLYNGSSSSSDITDYTNYSLAGDVTFYVKMYKVTKVILDGNGGTFDNGTLTTKAVKIKSSSVLSTAYANITIKKNGFLFKGWTKNTSTGTLVDGTETVTDSITLHAVWTTINTDLDGWWIGTSSGNSYSLFLNTTACTGMSMSSAGSASLEIYDGSLKIGNTTYTYTLNGGTLTVNGVSYTHPSEEMTANGSTDAVYYYNDYLITLKNDATFVMTYVRNTGLTASGKWNIKESVITLLDSNLKKITDLNSASLVDFAKYGGNYYNYAGTSEKNQCDAYSIYLGTDGTFTLYLYDSSVSGKWYVAGGIFRFLYPGETTYFDNVMIVSGTKFTGYGKETLTQGSAKGTLNHFTSDSALFGKWSTEVSGVLMSFLFNQEGDGKMTTEQGGASSVTPMYYTVLNNQIYFFMYESMSLMISPYTISGNSLTLTNASVTLTKE